MIGESRKRADSDRNGKRELPVSEKSHPVPAADPDEKPSVIRTRLHGIDLLFNSRLNKGTAFTEHERDAFGLHGLLPPHIGTLEDQRLRRKRVLDSRDTAVWQVQQHARSAGQR